MFKSPFLIFVPNLKKRKVIFESAKELKHSNLTHTADYHSSAEMITSSDHLLTTPHILVCSLLSTDDSLSLSTVLTNTP